ncbi:hypothetical protein HQ544_01275 [Candidatus Falkowbacteria bacterium]|nr:hypothetical protein [Candidatus Falkowbacteria bacterium]
MSLSFLEFVGLIGSIVILTAYLPQTIHLLKVKDSTGVSFLAWLIWGIGNALLLIYAITTRDKVYIILEAVSTSFIILLLFLIQKYKRHTRDINKDL